MKHEFCHVCGMLHSKPMACPVPQAYLDFWKKFPYHARNLSLKKFWTRYYKRKRLGGAMTPAVRKAIGL